MFASIIIICTVVVIFYLYFHRDPQREIPLGSNIVSPADGIVGRIIDVEKDVLLEKGVLGKIRILCSDISSHCVVIQIVMRPWDVHVQRSPITGIIDNIMYTKGTFHNALLQAPSFRIINNERNEITIKNTSLKIKVIQIAGALARRINCFVLPGHKVLKGSRLGAIVLGSQVCIILPQEKVHIASKEGDKVYAGTSIIATYKSEDSPAKAEAAQPA